MLAPKPFDPLLSAALLYYDSAPRCARDGNEIWSVSKKEMIIYRALRKQRIQSYVIEIFELIKSLPDRFTFCDRLARLFNLEGVEQQTSFLVKLMLA